MGKELKRMNYFDGIFLKADDYRQDKEYQRRLQGFHNRYLHTWGIVCGLYVKPVTDSNMEVYVTEGAALDLTVEGLDGTDIKESTSRQILIYEGHPENPIDLSEYKAGDNIYISVSYFESNADWNSERGQGEEIHIWERGSLNYSDTKPIDNKKNILLARVVPREVSWIVDGITSTEIVIDSTCIFDTDTDGLPLRVYAGPYAKVLELDMFIFKLSEDLDNMPFIKTYQEEEKNKLLIDSLDTKSLVKFTGTVKIDEDLGFEGTLISKKNGVTEKEFKTEEKFLQVNSLDDDAKELWKARDGGMDVFRGGPNVASDARIVWSEADMVWKAGLENDLYTIGYGEEWNKLINKAVYDGHHLHSKLSSKKGIALSADTVGNLLTNVDLVVNDNNLKFLSESKKGALAWYGSDKNFGKLAVDGPVLAGSSGGLLGTTSEGQKAILSWNQNGKVGIGSVNLNPTDDDLDIEGSSRLLIGSNPVRFTSQWTGFPDLTSNQAEICNDTTYYKALMIVGNQSAGQGRKVAIWDRLDVNGLLYVNGSLQMSNKLTVSAGNGNNGIVFPNNLGGGTGDGAWIKYYPRTGEACTLEIGTSNDGDDDILLKASGSVGIGTVIPKDILDVNEGMRIMGDTNTIRFTNSWSGFTEQSPKYAEICNDTTSYKSLMIAGNRSAGHERRVSIWDDLDVNGSLAVTGNIQFTGALVAGVGNCEVKGIMFEKDPGGGSGDAAWIRYYSDTLRGGGENMTLELGISNDSNIETTTSKLWVRTCPYPWVKKGCGYWKTVTNTINTLNGDRLRFRASGGTYIDGNFYYTSSKAYKENITKMSKISAQKAVESLEPVEFNFKGSSDKTTIGFIAENVPDILAASDKKAISPMEIITVLVSEVKEQEKAINKLKKKVAILKSKKNKI